MDARATSNCQLTIVIPVYNEAANIVPMLVNLAYGLNQPFQAVIVYDFDGDDTIRPAQQVACELEFPLHPIRNAYGRGPLGAIKTGLETSYTDYVAVMMADMSDPSWVLENMLTVARETKADIVCASRYMTGGRQIGGPLLKRTLSRWAGVSLHWLTGIPTHDVTNSFKLYSRRAIDTCKIESRAGFALAMELTIKAYIKDFKICEVPTVWRDRKQGKSRFRLWRWLPEYLRWYWYGLRRAL